MVETVAVVGGGPAIRLPDLQSYQLENTIWIGADRGCIHLLEEGIKPDYGLGDFDSVTKEEMEVIRRECNHIKEYPAEKDQTDLEIALQKAIELKPKHIQLFGVTGGRLDHELVNIQLLYQLSEYKMNGIIIDKYNKIELKRAGVHSLEYDEKFENISFIPQSTSIKNLTLKGFYYPLINKNLEYGTSLATSNCLIGKKGTFSFSEGILLVVRSHDVQL
ncbi:thiamine diphosphokinase [Salinibacillus xinjiangensis]|uniref:Thiamine diphosphokinase n=1 Tax=Salinibacillus xinjiangensis TaxID=1229268 RepID=A0A6G1X3F9_9BACI|nr:thiamine diphosphokinase [Salinibacillus xinjiangensis]MRG85445.1 thiamine diphosphokinase [Salinibacillus xinjiangensis]